MLIPSCPWLAESASMKPLGCKALAASRWHCSGCDAPAALHHACTVHARQSAWRLHMLAEDESSAC